MAAVAARVPLGEVGARRMAGMMATKNRQLGTLCLPQVVLLPS